jgi:cation diffusion facilitator family transporter
MAGKDIQKTSARPEKAAIYAVVVSTVLTTLKFIMVAATGSLAVTAEAFHSLSDIVTSVLVFVALRGDRLAEKKSGSPSRFFTFQWLISLFIGLILFSVSSGIFVQVFSGRKETIEASVPAGVLLLIAACGSYFLSKFELAVGKKTNSMALIADGHHSHVDMLGALLVSVSLFSNALGLNIDIYAAAVIGLLIGLQSLEILGNVVARVFKRKAENAEESYTSREQFIAGVIDGQFSLDKIFAFIEAKTGLSLLENMIVQFFLKRGKSIIVMAVVLAWASTSFVVVDVSQEALLFRWGRLLTNRDCPNLSEKSTLLPGLSLKYPWPVDSVVKAPVKKAQVVYVGFKGEGSGDRILWTRRHHEVEYEMLTGDSQFITVFLTVEYHIKDLLSFYLSAADSSTIVDGVANSEIIKLLSELEFFEMATVDRRSRATFLQEKMQKACDRLSLGLEIDLVSFKDIHPPVSVAPEFEAVISAEEEKESTINQAEAISNRLIPKARAMAALKKSEAVAYGVAVKEKARGDGERFILRLPENSMSRIVTKRKLFFDMERSVLKKPVKILVGDGCKPPLVYMVPAEASALAISEEYRDYER